jgi:hypothetical protein
MLFMANQVISVRSLVQTIDFRLLVPVAASFAFPLVLFPPLINLNEILVLRQF